MGKEKCLFELITLGHLGIHRTALLLMSTGNTTKSVLLEAAVGKSGFEEAGRTCGLKKVASSEATLSFFIRICLQFCIFRQRKRCLIETRTGMGWFCEQGHFIFCNVHHSANIKAVLGLTWLHCIGFNIFHHSRIGANSEQSKVVYLILKFCGSPFCESISRHRVKSQQNIKMCIRKMSIKVPILRIHLDLFFFGIGIGGGRRLPQKPCLTSRERNWDFLRSIIFQRNWVFFVGRWSYGSVQC